MATISEKQATPAQLITDLASTLTGLADWSDGDTDVTNDQTDASWSNNGRVLQHAPTGDYFLFYVATEAWETPEEYPTNIYGIRVVRSSGWDSTNNVPSGDTTVTSTDPFADSVTNHRSDSFTNTAYTYSAAYGNGLWFMTTGGVRDTFATETSLTYYLAGDSAGISIGAWNTADGSYGIASWYTARHITSKFWADGYTPLAQASATSASTTAGAADYAFQWSAGGMNASEGIGSIGGMDGGRWGSINPDSADDTYFVEYPVLYMDSGQTAPIAYLRQYIPNKASGGGAHGDTVNYDSHTFHIIDKSGASTSESITAGLRYE